MLAASIIREIALIMETTRLRGSTIQKAANIALAAKTT
jgi:hypothetical protein